MNSDADLDLLMDAVSDHLDIASLAGKPPEEIVAVVMLAVAQFLIVKMPVDNALAMMRAACDDLQARMPQMKEDPELKH